MAYICYDFYHSWDEKRENRIQGRILVKSLSVAEKMIEILNGFHGQGTHWPEEQEMKHAA